LVGGGKAKKDKSFSILLLPFQFGKDPSFLLVEGEQTAFKPREKAVIKEKREKKKKVGEKRVERPTFMLSGKGERQQKTSRKTSGRTKN